MKKILTFIIILLPWFLSSLIFETDTNFYKSINKPFFAPPGILFPIIWTILYILIATSIYIIISKKNNTKDYNKYLVVNYISNQIFTFLFFDLKSPFLALIDTVIVLLSSIYLYIETKSINKTASKLLIPYIIWNGFATILITSIFFLNI